VGHLFGLFGLGDQLQIWTSFTIKGGGGIVDGLITRRSQPTREMMVVGMRPSVADVGARDGFI
jgi:hypothetical protein